MKTMHTSRLLFSLVLVLLFSGLHAQDKKPEQKSTATDSVIIKTERYGFRVGVDLFKLSRSFYEKDYKGLELVGDCRFSKNYFLAGELGNENKTVNDERLNFTTKGTYFRVGFDYNLYENWLDMENKIYVGMRYGVSTFSQTLNSYLVYNRNDYFGETSAIVSGKNSTGFRPNGLKWWRV
jgi:hypothetical protein